MYAVYPTKVPGHQTSQILLAVSDSFKNTLNLIEDSFSPLSSVCSTTELLCGL